jgi:hypothetical protein
VPISSRAIAISGTALPVRLATTPAPIPPSTWPEAQAMFERPAAKPWCSRLASARSESRVSAGAKQRPAPSEVMISAARTVPSVCASEKEIIATAQIAKPTT